MTLVEVLIALTILTILAAGIISAVMTARSDAENNLYESTSLSVSISFLEQLMSAPISQITDPTNNAAGLPSISYVLGSGEQSLIPFNTFTSLEVPIISSETGTVQKKLNVEVCPRVSLALNGRAYLLSVEYRWKHPLRDKVYDGFVRNIRCINTSN